MEHEEMTRRRACARSSGSARSNVATTGYFAPIGSNGFYVRGGPKAEFDQQPSRRAMVSACLERFRVTGQKQLGDWSTRGARSAGSSARTTQQLALRRDTGGCRDGLHARSRNENQGAESTLSFLTALVEMRAADRALNSQPLARVAPRAPTADPAQ